MTKPFIIGVAGGSGSGKTTFVNGLKSRLSHITDISVIQMDSFYKDNAHLTFEEKCKSNFDHPDSIDFGLFQEKIAEASEGNDIVLPIYDFTTHSRISKQEFVKSNKVIIIDGILLFHKEEIRNLLDLKIFIDVKSDIRFIRRLQRDVKHRGRSNESVIEQYRETVEPMHCLFVEPTKRFADILVPVGGKNLKALEVVSTYISSAVK